MWRVVVISLVLAHASFAAAGQAERNVTAADWLGPDGIVYPDFTRAGIPGGIPDVKVVTSVDKFGAVPDDGRCDAAAFTKAAAAAGARGGGAVLVPEGTYVIDTTVNITTSGVVIRGADRAKTVIVPRFEGRDLSTSPPAEVVFDFHSEESGRGRSWLEADAKRGDTAVSCASSHFRPGDWVQISAAQVPERVRTVLGPAFQKMVAPGAVGWGTIFLYNRARVVNVAGGVVTFDRPLRGEFTLDTRPHVRQTHTPIRKCGLERLTIRQAVAKKGIDAVWLKDSVHCWVRDVTVLKIGNWPLGVHASNNYEVRDCLFDESLSRGGGGVAYVGLQFATDGLFENVTMTRLRHLSINMSSCGNVFRRCRLKDIDVNFHLIWPSENLFDNCVIDARGDRGTYGFGIYTPHYNGSGHLPAGPRNTFYNNDFITKHDGVYLGGGATSDGVFAYNRFVQEQGFGVLLRKGSNGNVFHANVFCIRDYTRHWTWNANSFYYEGEHARAWSGGVVVMSGPLSGNVFRKNAFYGVPPRDMFIGMHPVAVNERNVATASFVVAERPRAPAASLLAWQRGEEGPSASKKAAAASKRTASRPRAPTPLEGAVAEFDRMLVARLKERLAEGASLEVFLTTLRQRAAIGAVDGTTLRLMSRGTGTTMDVGRLGLVEKKALALKAAEAGRPMDHAVVAFYALASGDRALATEHLTRSGEFADLVRGFFVVQE